MNTKMFSYLLAGSLIMLAAWLVHAPKEARADVPEKYRDTVRKGLEYLVKQQRADGHWEGEGEGDGGQHPVAMTGLAGLALLMEKDGPRERRIVEKPSDAKHAAPIRKAVDWLIARSDAGRDGLLFSEHPSETTRYMEGHGLATLFLAGAYEEERDAVRQKKLLEVVTRAVTYIVKAQSSRGGWYHTSKVEGHDFDDILVTVIQIQALQAAENAGIGTAGMSLRDGQECLRSKLDNIEKDAKGKPHRTTELAGALAALRAHGEIKDAEAKVWSKLKAEIPLASAVQFGRDELMHYYYAQALFNQGGKTWENYRTPMFDHLQSTQKPDGSWPAGNGLSVGPVYATALWCTVLQLDKKSHPSARVNGAVEVR